jgi:hypothetical protein
MRQLDRLALDARNSAAGSYEMLAVERQGIQRLGAIEAAARRAGPTKALTMRRRK